MKERRAGNIVTLSSAAGRRPHTRSPIAYSVAKAGIELMTQDVAAQAGPYGIRVNCIAPETILTERNEQRIPDEQKAALIESHPIKRLGTPDDVARAVLFLVSDASSWITGVNTRCGRRRGDGPLTQARKHASKARVREMLRGRRHKLLKSTQSAPAGAIRPPHRGDTVAGL